jgi:tape measure domain-containing protein
VVGFGNDIKSIVTRNTSFIKGLSGNEIGDLSLAEAKFFEIKEAFKKAYAKFNISLTEGNLSLARAYSRTLDDVAKTAFIEIDSIKNNLAANGVSSAFGSKLATMAGSTKGVITSRYINPSKRNMGLVEQQENLHNQTLGIGKEVLAGVTQGLGNTGAVGLASDKVGRLILTSLKNSLGIASPSKKAATVMLDVIRGLIVGLESGAGNLFSKMQGVGSGLLGSFKKGVNTISKGALFPTFADKRAMIPERQEFGTEAYFDKVWGKAANKLTDLIGKGLNMKHTEARETTKELGAAVFAKSMLAHPGTTTLALFAPLAQAIAPLYVLFSTMRDSIIMPLLNTVRGALERTEPIKQSLNFIAGSKEAGQSELGYLSKVSDKYGTGLESGAQGYIQLSAAAAGTKLEGQGVKDLYEGISASIRAMNLSTADGSLVFQAYTQMLSKGKISMEELRQQLAEKSPQALQIFAKAMGVSVSQLQVMSAKGQLISEEVLPKVARQLKATFKIDSFAESYISSVAKMQTASFNFSSKVADYFGGMFGGAISFGADLVNAITSKFKYISNFLNIALIGVMAQVAVGTQAIMGLSVIKPKLEWFQNLVVSSFKLSMKTISPFMFGIFVDMFDDVLGAKNSINQNMAKGVTAIFTSLASLFDNESRNFKGKSLFELNFDVKPSKDLLTSFGEGLRGLFASVPSGVIEFGALFVMLESLFVLGKMLLLPMMGNLISGLGAMARSFLFAASSGETWKGILRVLIADSSLAKGAFIASSTKRIIAITKIDATDIPTDSPILEKVFDLLVQKEQAYLKA